MTRMPVLFIGHGSPMNALETNDYTRAWQRQGEAISRPKAILVISAHWFAPGLFVNNQHNPRQIYDMYGFPQPLYDLVYPVKGSSELASKVAALTGAAVNNDWGIDHGTWSVLVHLFPKADIPVVQLSVNRNASPAEQFALGQKLSVLRDENILILGSGNIVHNLRQINFQQTGGAVWAERFDNQIRDKIVRREFSELLNPETWSEDAQLAIPTPDHYWPILPILGAVTEADQISIFNQDGQYGSLSMTSYAFSEA